MKCNPWRWLWGLVPILVLGWIAILSEREHIEADLTSRTQTVLERKGYKWATVHFEGRDALITGRAIEESEAPKAFAAVSDTLGVRIVENGIALVDTVVTYEWSAMRRDERIRVNGVVPSDKTRREVIGIVKANFPSFEVDDRMKLARGAPPVDVWMGGVGFGLKQLALLREGRVELENTSISVRGMAQDARGYRAVKAALSGQMPQGIRLKSDAVKPPRASPFTWSARRQGNEVVLNGHVPTDDVRDAMMQTIRRVLPKATIVDHMDPASGEPDRFLDAANAVLLQLARLDEGDGKLRDKGIQLKGVAETADQADQVRDALKQGVLVSFGAGGEIRHRETAVEAISPYATAATLEASKVVLSGYVPDEAARATLIDMTRHRFDGLTVDDRLQIGAGQPASWQRCIEVGLNALRKLGTGRMALTDRHLRIAGATEAEALAQALPGSVQNEAGQACETAVQVSVDVAAAQEAKSAGQQQADAATARQQAEEDQLRAEAAARQQAEEDQRRAEAAARQKAQEDQRRADAAARQKAEDEQRRVDAAARQKAEDEQRRADAAARQKAEEDQRRADAAARQKAEEDQRRADAAARQKAEEDQRRADAAARQKAEDEQRRAEAAARQKAQEEQRRAEAAARQKAEEEQRRADAAARQQAQEEQRRADAAARQQAQEEQRRAEAARQKAEEEQRRADAAARQKAEEEQRRADAAARQKAEEEQRRADAAARQQAEEEQRRADAAARQKAEEEQRRADAAAGQQAQEQRRTEASARRKEETERIARLPATEKQKVIDSCQEALSRAAREGIINFNRASFDLDPTSYATLNRVAEAANRCPALTVEIEGHTDSEGTAARNQRLSDRRANTVREYLSRAGVEPSRLEALGFGATRPVASNDTPDGRAKNRRIEFVVKFKQ